LFVADFLGVSNLMDADAVGSTETECTIRVGDFTLLAGCGDVGARGPVKIVARPERVLLLAHETDQDNCLPGMVQRTVYVGPSLQVIVRLATGATVQASVTNTGTTGSYRQGTPVAVRVLAAGSRPIGSEDGSQSVPARAVA
jgi:ABC-type Fe3+/spermidine/putrescine transport system ATPase subunit